MFNFDKNLNWYIGQSELYIRVTCEFLENVSWYLGKLRCCSLLLIDRMTRPSNGVLVKPFIWNKSYLFLPVNSILYRVNSSRQNDACQCKSTCPSNDVLVKPFICNKSCQCKSTRPSNSVLFKPFNLICSFHSISYSSTDPTQIKI